MKVPQEGKKAPWHVPVAKKGKPEIGRKMMVCVGGKVFGINDIFERAKDD